MSIPNYMTISGNLTDDPKVVSFSDGDKVVRIVNITVAHTPRYRDARTNEWRDGKTLFQRAVVRGLGAENVAASLRKGTRVIVAGSVAQDSYISKTTNEKVTYTEIQVDAIGPDLTLATAVVTPVSKKTGQA